MASETDIAIGVMRIAAAQPNGTATYRRARRELPGLVKLNARNRDLSQTRPGEEMWHQIVRNIKSHDIAGTNYFAQGLLRHVPRVGYQITKAGRAHLTANGF